MVEYYSEQCRTCASVSHTTGLCDYIADITPDLNSIAAELLKHSEAEAKSTLVGVIKTLCPKKANEREQTFAKGRRSLVSHTVKS